MDKQQQWANQLRRAGWANLADRVEAGQTLISAILSELALYKEPAHSKTKFKGKKKDIRGE